MLLKVAVIPSDVFSQISGSVCGVTMHFEKPIDFRRFNKSVLCAKFSDPSSIPGKIWEWMSINPSGISSDNFGLLLNIENTVFFQRYSFLVFKKRGKRFREAKGQRGKGSKVQGFREAKGQRGKEAERQRGGGGLERQRFREAKLQRFKGSEGSRVQRVKGSERQRGEGLDYFSFLGY